MASWISGVDQEVLGVGAHRGKGYTVDSVANFLGWRRVAQPEHGFLAKSYAQLRAERALLNSIPLFLLPNFWDGRAATSGKTSAT